MKQIQRIILHNFKRFKDLDIELNPRMNIFIGDNESGKSTILQAIDIVARGSRTKIEEIGLDRLFNVDVINAYMCGDKKYENLPRMYVELYLNEQHDILLNGKNNSKGIECDGIKLVCEPNDDYSSQIHHILNSGNTFPFEFYLIRFDTFQGQAFNGYNKQIKSIFIDNSQIGNLYSMNEYVKGIYSSRIDSENRIGIKHQYRTYKDRFKTEVLDKFNVVEDGIAFALKNTPQSNIDTDITILANNVPIENKGTGMQCFIKTELSLQKAEDDIDTVLIEEPESHLSYIRMLELIDKIENAQNRQLFIATHSDLIATRLDLRNCYLINTCSDSATSLKDVDEDTAKYFIKAPDNNLLRFALSDKIILVEGDAEYILMDVMFQRVCDKTLREAGVGVISVDGKCFKRYLSIAKYLQNKVAVITDNDKDYTNNIQENYKEYDFDKNIGIYADKNNDHYTFEVCMYKNNKDVCDKLFASPQRRVEIQDYMLINKTKAAFRLASEKYDEINVPVYIVDALKWING